MMYCRFHLSRDHRATHVQYKVPQPYVLVQLKGVSKDKRLSGTGSSHQALTNLQSAVHGLMMLICMTICMTMHVCTEAALPQR